MYLNEKDCHRCYCMQAGSGSTSNYFQGIRYQRGGGWFQQIFRSISPLMIKAGKYFGRKLLRTGGNVMSDIASGSSLKDSARARFQETGDNIKDDLFKKLQQHQQGEGIKKRRQKKSTHSTFKRAPTRTSKKRKKKPNFQAVSKRRKTSHNLTRDIFS